jgi:hypothetical protein
MDIETIIIDQAQAEAKLREYRAIPAQSVLDEDLVLRRLYRAAKAGLPILNVAKAFQSTGLSEKGHPRLAMARATWKTVYWRYSYDAFCDARTGRVNKPNRITPPVNWRVRSDLHTPVPHIPPSLRPQEGLDKYFVLFEVPDWTEYSADPFLLRHIAGWLYAVHGEWELTELETSLLGA